VKCLVQRVSHAEVLAGGSVVGAIGTGYLVFVGAERGDRMETAETAARKIAGLRIFEDENGRMNRGLTEVGGSVLVVSQFTLAADLSRGRRPGFERALPSEEARPLYERFVSTLAGLGLPVQTGTFGAMMRVSLVNEGPATFLLEIEP
jgi:D-tyrosyl-tRNA(Tyr) deacylase